MPWSAWLDTDPGHDVDREVDEVRRVGIELDELVLRNGAPSSRPVELEVRIQLAMDTLI